ncbi:MAG: hypothetical protein ACRDQU_12085 [Pseudonocardiaceae bacterium]
MQRLPSFLELCYLLNYVDQISIGFAALTTNPDLGLSAAASGPRWTGLDRLGPAWTGLDRSKTWG